MQADSQPLVAGWRPVSIHETNEPGWSCSGCGHVDPVVDRVERTDRLGCFVDRLHRLVDDFTTRLDLDDFRSTWYRLAAMLIIAFCSCFFTAWQLMQNILCPST